MTATVTLPNEPLQIAVTLDGRAAVCRVERYTLDDAGRLVPMANTVLEVTEKGRAAAAYLKARANHYEAVNASRDREGAPDYDAPEVIATGIVMTVAADWYRDTGGYICEDCGQLEKCVCPDV